MRYTLHNLNLFYTSNQGEKVSVLHDISLDLQEDDFIGLLGDSGSGKTQLASALALLNTFYDGQLQSDKQEFEREGKVLNLKHELNLSVFRQKHIGYIFQESFGYFNPTKMIKNQMMNENSNLDELKEMMSCLNLQNTDRIMNSYPHQLSGGQLQRISIIKCLLKRPAIIIADEIDSALDFTNARMAMDLILSQKEKYHFALVWITHDKVKAKAITQKIWYVEHGKLVFNDTAANFELKSLHWPVSKKLRSDQLLIELKNITKSYSKNSNRSIREYNMVLNNVNFKIHRNETVGLIGHSGSGKSTIGKILSMLEKQDSGDIYIRDTAVKQHKPSKEIIYLFQDAYSSLNPTFSVQEILNEAIKESNSAITIEELLVLFNLDNTILIKRPHQLSGGMRQRVALLRALAVKPGLLILDESLNAMDTALQMIVIKILLEYQAKYSMSILIISHQLDLIKNLADRVYAIDNGALTLVNDQIL